MNVSCRPVWALLTVFSVLVPGSSLDKGDGWGFRQGGHCFASHLSLIGFGSRNGDMFEVVLCLLSSILDLSDF